MFPDPNTPPTNANAASSQEPTIAFCQQCGRPLTVSTRRQVGNGTFCEPCATIATARAAQSAQNPGWSPVTGTSPYPGATASGVAGQPAQPGEPNPRLAGFLGLIPGVGAMYNGQYAKGAVHLILFVVLLSLADSVSDVLYWLVWGWVFYQAFEAYHTAVARRDGQPLPDPFGWNDLGERMGFHRTSPPVARATPRPFQEARPPYTPPPPATAAEAPFPPPVAEPSASYNPFVDPAPMTASFTTATAVPPVSPVPPANPAPPADPVPDFASGHPSTHVPYADTFTGPASPVGPPPVAPLPARRFPVGALWLIGLGIVFLIGNIVPDWRLSGRWIVPFLLGAAALWAGTSRAISWRDRAVISGVPGPLDTLANALLFPAVLLTFAILLALQVAGGPHLGHTWPAILIVWGALLLLGRLPNPTAASDPSGEDGNPPERRNSATSILG